MKICLQGSTDIGINSNKLKFIQKNKGLFIQQWMNKVNCFYEDSDQRLRTTTQLSKHQFRNKHNIQQISEFVKTRFNQTKITAENANDTHALIFYFSIKLQLLAFL